MGPGLTGLSALAFPRLCVAIHIPCLGLPLFKHPRRMPVPLPCRFQILHIQSHFHSDKFPYLSAFFERAWKCVRRFACKQSCRLFFPSFSRRGLLCKNIGKCVIQRRSVSHFANAGLRRKGDFFRCCCCSPLNSWLWQFTVPGTHCFISNTSN